MLAYLDSGGSDLGETSAVKIEPVKKKHGSEIANLKRRGAGSRNSLPRIGWLPSSHRAS